MTKLHTDRICAAIVFFAVFVTYFLTSAPGLGLVDSGELTVVALKLGIAHPTGYPLYTILGRVWSMIAITSPDRAMVIFSALFGAVACGLLSLTTSLCFSMIGSKMSRSLKILSSVFLPLAFAYSYSNWTSISFAEVYPLTWFCACILIYLSFVISLRENTSNFKLLAILSYIWGLSFGNHLTILWFFPLIAYCVLRQFYQGLTLKQLFPLAVLFFLGCSVNCFLPFRSFVDPVLDWSDPETPFQLFKHLTAWQYQQWMFQDNIAVFFDKIIAYFRDLPFVYGAGLTIFAFIGGVYAILNRLTLIIFLLLAWLIGITYNLNYDILDISSYFVAFNCLLYCASIIGFIAVANFLNDKLTSGSLAFILTVLLSVLPAVSSFATSVVHSNQKQNLFAENYTKEILRTLPKGSLVLQGNWDIHSAYLYLSHVSDYRKDVVMLDLNLLQRTWYLKQEMRQHPDIFSEVKPEISAFIEAVMPFEANLEYDGDKIESAFVELNNKIITSNQAKRPVYIKYAKEIGHPGVGANIKGYPAGFFYRLSDSVHYEEPLLSDSLKINLNISDPREQYLLTEAAAFSATQGSYALSRSDTQIVIKTVKTCTDLMPDHPYIAAFLQKARNYIKNN